MRNTMLALAAFIAFAAPAPAPAYADQACQSVAELTLDVTSHAPDTLTVERIADVTGPNVAALASAYNALPPASDNQADEVLIFHAVRKDDGREHPQWVVALFFKGCKQAAALVPAAQFKELVGLGV